MGLDSSYIHRGQTREVPVVQHRVPVWGQLRDPRTVTDTSGFAPVQTAKGITNDDVTSQSFKIEVHRNKMAKQTSQAIATLSLNLLLP